jgi:P27 family predicted phage terminase small subunit
VKKARGTYRPSRAAKGEVLVKIGRPDTPDWLDEEGRREWKRVCDIFEEAKVLSPADQSMLADYCAAHSLAVNATKAYLKTGILPKQKKESHLTLRAHPMIKVAQEARAQAMRIGIEFGLSPASRSRVSGNQGDAGKGGEEGRNAKDDKDDGVPLFGPPRLVAS